MPQEPLTIRVIKGRDSKDLLVCERAGGTSTWHRVPEGMPVHDLAHLAVESTLELADAFYGLVADGWDIETFEEPGASRRLPGIALWTEVVVFLLQTELGSGTKQAAPDFNATVSAIAGAKHITFNRHLTSDELGVIRQSVRTWCDEWRALAPGEELVFHFVPGIANGLKRVAAR